MLVRGPARFSTVALTVVIMAEGAEGGGWQPSPQDPPAHLASGQGSQGTDWGLCPAGLHRPRQGHPWTGPGLEAEVNLSPVPVSVTS